MKLLHFVQIIDYVKWHFFSCSPKWAKTGSKTGFRAISKDFDIKKLSLLYKINRFHVAVRLDLFSNRSQTTSKCGKNISDTLGYRHCFVLTTF